MGSISRIIVEGNLGHTPELRQTQSGKEVTNLRVAVKCGWGDRQSTWWVSCVVWGKLAPIVAQLDKGQRVTIDGRPTVRKWTKRDGTESEEMEIDVDAVSWDAREQRSEAPPAQRDEPPPPDDEDEESLGF